MGRHPEGDRTESRIVITDEATCRLANDLARLTGETVNEALTLALRERLVRERRKRGVEERLKKMRAISKRCARSLRDGPSAVEHGDFLYDEHGLPK
ncbi:MAG: type II toxin-antitoxin system VapB family antitoxin [Chloroflexota bacterium]|nr:type II toxin-antitoxin system VapB family antitoxin [Chloroflexota bacterium]MDE2899392.1 type II toxin-antitoxin system VapB family antitoxin [Chloroflexota bacterium]